MIRATSVATVAMNILFYASTASAQVVDPDVRCVVVSKFFATVEKDPQKKQVAFASAFFFAGRVDGRIPLAQLKFQFASPGAQVKASDAATLMNGCAKRFRDSQLAFLTVGRPALPALPKK